MSIAQASIIILNTITAFVMYMVAMYFFFEALIVVVEYWDNFDRWVNFNIGLTLRQVVGRMFMYILGAVLLVVAANTMLITSLKSGGLL